MCSAQETLPCAHGPSRTASLLPGYLRLCCFGGKRREEPRSPATSLMLPLTGDACLVPPGSTCLQQEPGESQGGLARDGRVFHRAVEMRAKRFLYNTL